ncbi:alanine racemase [Anaerosacchariphilus polymeriproducens]|uniref:Alanine racemase n=1 Tax=Anaerosacchariphilus polymeriproducens TaxID=1812858 RepID=A0A371AU31_9FIRM|nr:alanine racemase [Anaerosacchariphilus polymeriproducens]RDU23010.1 alanine racemase [Anaerosacchariphilus polymeriproducens]
MYSRVFATINLDAVRSNFNQMKRNIDNNCKIMAVIKTDAYGHGAIQIANEFQNEEYLYGFAVATVEEAQILIRHGIYKPILILGYAFQEHYEGIVKHNIRSTVFKYETAQLLSEEAVKQGKEVAIHIAVDTGMSRIGFQVEEESVNIISKIHQLRNLKIEGIFTHFAKADEVDKEFSFQQINKFNKFTNLLEEKGIIIPLKHSSNSAGIIEIREANMNIVRAGISIYGLWPSQDVTKDVIKLTPALGLKSHIVHVKKLPAGRSISYGGTYVTKTEETIATIPIGYGDGYPRGLSNKGYVLIHGQKAPIRGRVCMDQFMVDVSGIDDVKDGDEVVLIGEQQGEYITVEELSELCGRFNYEFICDLGKRIPRVFYKNGKIVEKKDYFNE